MGLFNDDPYHMHGLDGGDDAWDFNHDGKEDLFEFNARMTYDEELYRQLTGEDDRKISDDEDDEDDLWDDEDSDDEDDEDADDAEDDENEPDSSVSTAMPRLDGVWYGTENRPILSPKQRAARKRRIKRLLLLIVICLALLCVFLLWPGNGFVRKWKARRAVAGLTEEMCAFHQYGVADSFDPGDLPVKHDVYQDETDPDICWLEEKSLAECFKATNDLTEALESAAYEIRLKKTKYILRDDGMTEVAAQFRVLDLNEYDLGDLYRNFLKRYGGTAVAPHSDAMLALNHEWADHIKEKKESEDAFYRHTYRTVTVRFLTDHGRLVGWRREDGSDEDLTDVLMGCIPSTMYAVEQEMQEYFGAYREISYPDRMRNIEDREKAAEDSDTETPAAGSDSDTSPGASTPGTSGTKGSDTVRPRKSRGSTHASDEEEEIDPDDHDIEGYYEDYRDDFEDEDDAYDGFLDDGEDAAEDY